MLYAVLDVVRVGFQMEQVRQTAPLYLPLYRGPEDAQHEEMAPCLIGYEPSDAFAQWFARSRRESVGIGIEATASPEELRKHLRRFLMVEFEGEDRRVYFRYYDPNILRVFLPTCDADQLAEFFGPIQAFFVYDAEVDLFVRFTRQHGQLLRLPLERTVTM